MPAFSSFSKTYLAKSKYIAYLQDRLAFYLAISQTKLVSKAKSFSPKSERSQCGNDQSDRFSRLYVGQYSKLNEDTDTSKACTFGSVIHQDSRGSLWGSGRRGYHGVSISRAISTYGTCCESTIVTDERRDKRADRATKPDSLITQVFRDPGSSLIPVLPCVITTGT